MSLDVLNIVLTIGFIGMTAAGAYSVWQSFHIDISHKPHPSK
ncbi:MAG: hypothetical protein WCW84_07970 [Sulfurimonas sp.]|jgi:hypothetical protein